MSLQITSMADIFIILLVFLLKNASTNVSNVSPSAEMNLPQGKSEASPKDSLKLEVTKNAVYVDGKVVSALQDFRFENPADTDVGRQTDAKILQALMEQRKALPSPSFDSGLVVLSDEAMPYETLQRILSPAASAGFVDLQLIVVKAD